MPQPNTNGNYLFLAGIAPYSSGVVAMPGYEIIHATLQQPLPYREGFMLIDRHLSAIGRPHAALCAIELRSPAPYSFEGFNAFNRQYVDLLVDWNLLVDGQNPIARTNVAPAPLEVAETLLYAFSYTVPAADPSTPLTFVVAGAGEVGRLTPSDIVRSGETSADAMTEKANYVMGIMQQRLARLHVGWTDVTAIDIYTVQPVASFLVSEILKTVGPAAIHGICWYYSRPPIQGLEFEMDMRGIRSELRLA